MTMDEYEQYEGETVRLRQQVAALENRLRRTAEEGADVISRLRAARPAETEKLRDERNRLAGMFAKYARIVEACEGVTFLHRPGDATPGAEEWTPEEWALIERMTR